jgi:phospholipid/cholesterol/gamma-HCH transport system permease protein
MEALQNWLMLRGRGFYAWAGAWARVLRFGAMAVSAGLSPATYNRAMLQVVQKQIYFTAWQILPGFALFSALFSALIILIVGETARDYGLYQYALELVFRILVLEMLPLMTALFVALRTGAAINTEVALMKIQNELGALERIGVDPYRLELLPRVIGGSVSVLSMTAVNIVVGLALAHLLIVDLRPWSLPPDEFTRVFGEVLDPQAMLVLWLKTLAFGLAVTVIPISEGLATPQKIFYAPISVLRGMVRLFFALMLLEAAALALLYV